MRREYVSLLRPFPCVTSSVFFDFVFLFSLFGGWIDPVY